MPYLENGAINEVESGASVQFDIGATLNVLGTQHLFPGAVLTVDAGATATVACPLTASGGVAVTGALTIGGVSVNNFTNAFGSVAFDRGIKVKRIALAGGTDTAGGIGSWQNNEAGTIVILRTVVVTTVVASSANTIDVGTTATNATTDSANLISALNVHSALVCSDNLAATTGAGTCVTLATGKWVTVSTTPSTGGASAALAGFLYIEYINQ